MLCIQVHGNSARCIVVSAIHDKKYLFLVLYSLDSYNKRPGYSGMVSLAGGTQQNTNSLHKRKCTTIHSRGHNYVRILHAIHAATARNQTGPPPQSAQRNSLPYHRVSRRKSQCTRRYTRISSLVTREVLLLCVNSGVQINKTSRSERISGQWRPACN